MNYVDRPAFYYDLPLHAGIDLLHPEQVVLRFGVESSIDLGALCYLQRSPHSRRTAGSNADVAGRQVIIESFDHQRAKCINTLIRFISDEISSGRKRLITAYTNVSYVNRFINWADEHDFQKVLASKDVTVTAFRAYVGHLRERINLSTMNGNTGAGMQNGILDVIANAFDMVDLHHGINLLTASTKYTNSTRPPDEDSQSKVLSLCTALFDGLSDLVINNLDYPYCLKVPKYLEYPKDSLWVFPTDKWCCPPALISSIYKSKRGFKSYDYANGRLFTPEEIEPFYLHTKGKSPLSQAKYLIKKAKKLLDKANADSSSMHRLDCAAIAHNAFLVLFMAHTGMNLASIRELPWNGDFEVDVERQGFRSIKYRAQGRIVSFEVQPIFVGVFKRYLSLRKFLLNGNEFDLLFMCRERRSRKIQPLKPKTLTQVFNNLQTVDLNLPTILSKQWRAGKSDWLLRNTDISTTALILQNSEKTVIKSYAEGSETIQMNEMSNFYEHVENTVVNREIPVQHSTPLAVGVCSSFNSPHQSPNAPIQADCKCTEGCLFCDKFKVHADEKDTRKLLSCSYCLQQTSHLTVNEEHFQSLFNPVFARINQILVEIDKREPGMVEKIRLEVEVDGELDPYWAGKIEMLNDLGLTA